MAKGLAKRDDVGVRSIRIASGIILGTVAAALLACGSWLLVAADEGDGGREPVGALSLAIGVRAQ